MLFYLYSITNIINNNMYIGITNDPSRRYFQLMGSPGRYEILVKP
jgi:predicted GIY-YIG superfamily endonuclease